MPSAGAIRAGRAYVELYAKDGRLVKGLRRASAKLKAFGASVTMMGLKFAGLGAAAAVPLALSVKSFMKAGDALDKMSRRTGVSVEQLSELAHAANLSGTDLKSLEKSVGRMQRTITDAGLGLSTAIDAFDMLGVTVKDFEGLKPADQFTLIAEGLSRIKDPTRKAAAAMMIFGRSGTALLPMMERGARGMIEMRQEARALGLTMSTEEARAAAKLTDDMARLVAVLKRAVFTIGSALAPALTRLAEYMSPLITKAGEWLKQNKRLVTIVAAVVGGIIAAGLAISVLGGIISAVGAIVGLFTTAFSILAGAIGFLLSPIGIVIAALGALAGYMLYSTEAGGKALGWLGEKFALLKEDAEITTTGIMDALKAGDIGLAAKILWLGLKVVWQRGIGWLLKLWLNFKHFFIRIGTQAFSGLLIIGEYIWHGLEVAWIEVTSFLSKTWTKFSTGVVKAWRWTGNKLRKAWNSIKGLFSDSFDAEAANRSADEAYKTGIEKLNAERDAKIKAREEKRKADRESAKAVHDATLSNIVKEQDEREKALDDEYDRRVKNAEAEVAAARKQLKDAADEAKRKRVKREREKDEGPEKLKDPPGLDELMKRMGSVATSFEKTTDKITVTGTFSTAAAFGMGLSGKWTQRAAVAGEATAKNTKKILDEQKAGQKFA